MQVASACVVLHTSAVLMPAHAQQWNDPRALTLVRQASDRRAQQLADSGLVDFQATAHGYLTFLAQLGEGFREPPQVVKADELALQLYWRAPNLSKQRIVGRRDTTLLPTDIQYHRDHLGIVQNNFPAIIRLGDGDEVKDVPHPLSAQGLKQYDFALADSLRISIPGRVINVYEVKVRPKDDRQARVIGALYLDRDNAQVVRMALSFTRAAFLDKQLEDLFIVLENGLVGTQFWLPRRQEIEIRRTATWLDYPVRGIIRGRWEIGDYQLNVGIPLSQFAGPEIVQAPSELTSSYRFPSVRILDSLPPDVRAVTADEIRRVQAEARALVREQALRRTRGSALAARGISDFARFNRVEGVALGAGFTGRLGQGFSVSGLGRYGLQDHAGKGRVDLAWHSARGTAARVYVSRDHRDAGDVAERSLFLNSIAAQEFGSDFTDPYRVSALGVSMTTRFGSTSWTLDVAREKQEILLAKAYPAYGRLEPLLPADSVTGTRASLVIARPTGLWLGGLEMRARLEIRGLSKMRGLNTCVGPCEPTNTLHAAADVELERPLKGSRLISRTIGAAARGWNTIPVQELVFMGGPVSGPGYGYHSLVGDGAISQRVELQFPVAFPAVSLGRFGRSPARITAAPFAAMVAVNSADLSRVSTSSTPSGGGAQIARLGGTQSGLRTSVGLGFLFFFDLIRTDVAYGFRGHSWTFMLDVNRSFWGVL